MPNIRFSFARLKEHFRRRGAWYIVCAVLAACASWFVFDATAPQTPNENLVKFYVVETSTSYNNFAELGEDLFAAVSEQDDSVLQIDFETFAFRGAKEEDNPDQTEILALLARLASGDADVIIANQKGYEYILNTGAYQPIDAFLTEGWLADYAPETFTVVTEDGETVTAAVSIDQLDGIYERGCMFNKGCYLMIAGTCTNVESTLDAVEELFALTGVK